MDGAEREAMGGGTCRGEMWPLWPKFTIQVFFQYKNKKMSEIELVFFLYFLISMPKTLDCLEQTEKTRVASECVASSF